jgi:hypothetical protein
MIAKGVRRFVANGAEIVTNLLLTGTRNIPGAMGSDPRRNYEADFGYPDECWAMDPEVYEVYESKDTPFEKAWAELNTRIDTLGYLHRIDVLSGIGQFGVLLLGLSDSGDLAQPVAGMRPDGTIDPASGIKHELLYIRAFDETLATVKEIEQDRSNRRYGQPLYYNLKFQTPFEQGNVPGPPEGRMPGGFSEGGKAQSTIDAVVHWSRVVHVADNRMSSEVFGLPRMHNVYNRLCDLIKVLGSSGEMFYRGAMPGLSFEVNPDIVDFEIDKDALKEEMEAYSNNLSRYLATVGLTAKSLAPQVASPVDHIRSQLEAITIALKVPLRVFLGSEEAKLSSTQDARTWNKRLSKRQNKYLTPLVIRPFVDRLIAFGVLPTPERYSVEWPDLNTSTNEDAATNAAKLTDALAKYVAGQVETVMPFEVFLTTILKLKPLEAKTIADAARNAEERLTPKPPPVTAPGAKGPPQPNRQPRLPRGPR